MTRAPMQDCACGILVRRDRILLGKRSPGKRLYPDTWDVFGGHRERGETVEATLIRELDEELGIVPTTFRFIEVLAEPDPRKYGDRAYHMYSVREWRGGEPRLLGDEHTEMRWFSVADAIQLDLALPGYAAIFRGL